MEGNGEGAMTVSKAEKSDGQSQTVESNKETQEDSSAKKTPSKKKSKKANQHADANESGEPKLKPKKSFKADDLLAPIIGSDEMTRGTVDSPDGFPRRRCTNSMNTRTSAA